MREAEVWRKTKETNVYVKVNLDGLGLADVKMETLFCSHMLTVLSTHSLIDLTIKASGDLKHHIIEDASLCLGDAIRKALGEGKGIARFGYAIVPMDCSLAVASIDLSGRPYSRIDLGLKSNLVEDMSSEDISHFICSLAASMRANTHVQVQYGENDHHKAEAAFKALALSLRQAVSIDSRRKGTPSSKGVL